jgi:hypothetical protein
MAGKHVPPLGDNCWPLADGSSILFFQIDGGIFVDHASRSWNSFGYVGLFPTREQAEHAATLWLKDHGLRRRALTLTPNPGAAS